MEKVMFEKFGTMIDCSRNGVMKVETVKKWIDITSDMGYNLVMLYLEDTYEVDNHPYFGQNRGRYTKAELKEIDRYAESKNVEIIPCIQTLAHLNALTDWRYYNEYFDCNDILLVGEPKVYELIDGMFKTMSECFRTKHINIGMDEAHMVTRGKYYDLHGDTDKIQVLVEHIRKVAKIGEKYGFSFSMWSDMFFRLASGGGYYNPNVTVTDEIRNLIPDNVELVYWDYYSKDKNHYDKMIKAHELIKKGCWFAGGAWSWNGFSPLNKFSIDATKAALNGCIKNGVSNFVFTMWGDDTTECSRFALLPTLFYASELAKGNKSIASIKEKFKEKYKISFDRFMNVDLTSNGECVNPSKYILYNDLFNGKIDSLIKDDTAKEHKVLAKKLALLKHNENFGYLFETLSCLSSVIAQKAELGKKIKEAYKNDDIQELKNLIVECKKLIKLLDKFYIAFEKQWMTENKATGFDVQDIRLGGFIARVKHCTNRLQDYVNGKIDKIDELEEETLDFLGRGTEYVQEDVCINSFNKTFTANRFSW